MPPRVGIVLAGGQSLRFGRSKAWALHQGTSFVERIYGLMKEFFEETWVVLHQPSPDFHPMNVLLDDFPCGGPLNGIYSALRQTKCSSLFVSACDLPFLHRQDIKRLLNQWRDDFPALAFKKNSQWEPLCGIYHRSLLPLMELKLRSEQFSLKNLLETAEAKYLDYAPAGKRDGLININTQLDYFRYLNTDGSVF